MSILETLTNALLDVARVDETAGDNDAAYRKQMHIVLNAPGVRHALARARDAPAESAAPAQVKPARKRKPKEPPGA